MARSNVARDVLWPKDKNVLVRVAALYVGQGSSAIVFAAKGDSYDVLVVDINMDKERGGIDVPRLIKDLLDGDDLYAFVNTHPHDDHTRGVLALSESVTIKNVWHSGHIPSKKYGACFYDELKKVIDTVKKAGGDEIILEGSKSSNSLGDAAYHVLSPAEYVTDEVNEEKADERYRRIHEQCAVIKFGKDETWVMIPGDADHVAFREHITEYHKERLGAFALFASHHGSRSFFRETEDDEPYLDALDAIDPSYVVISAPKRDESPHEHPHEDAVELYADKVGEENLFHTGEDRHCFIVDIYKDGTYSAPTDDAGKLVNEYGLSPDDEGDKSTKGGYSPREKVTVIGASRFA